MSYLDRMATILIVWTILFLLMMTFLFAPRARASPFAPVPGKAVVVVRSPCVEGAVRDGAMTSEECIKGASRATARPLQAKG